MKTASSPRELSTAQSLYGTFNLFSIHLIKMYHIIVSLQKKSESERNRDFKNLFLLLCCWIIGIFWGGKSAFSELMFAPSHTHLPPPPSHPPPTVILNDSFVSHKISFPQYSFIRCRRSFYLQIRLHLMFVCSPAGDFESAQMWPRFRSWVMLFV